MAKRIIIFIAVVLFLSCAKRPYKKTFVVSGTYLTVTSHDKRAAKIVYDEFRRLNNIFNIYNPQSEVSRLNRTYNKPFNASKEMLELLSLSKKLYKLTGGYLDVTGGKVYNFWKKIITHSKKIKIPSESTIRDLMKKGGMEFVEVNSGDKTVIIKKKGLLLDFSAIAKGYMVDKAAMRLNREGIKSALIDAGGDIYCLGKDKDKPWNVGIRSPSVSKGIIDTIPLFNEAVATTGDYEQFFDCKGRRYSHIINPKTGYPADNGIVSVTIITKNCTTADGLATAFFAMGMDNINNFLGKTLHTMKIFIVTKTAEGEKIYVF